MAGFDPSAFEFLARAERDHFWFAARRKLIVDLADKYAPSATRLLEVGCGSGNVIDALARSRTWTRVVGTELHPSGLEHAARRVPAQVELLQADARSLPFTDAFDLVGAFDVLEHVVEDEHVIAEVRRALVPRGLFIATVPQHPRLWSTADDVAHHERRYRRGELESKLVAAGFEVVFTTSYTALLLPLMVLSRMRRAKANDGDMRRVVREEFEIAPWLNTTLSCALRVEVAMTARGMSWPAGGSRVVVARRA